MAVLQLKSLPKTSEVLTLQVSNNLKQGDAVIAIGHPAGFEFTVSNGIISAIRKTAEMPEQVQAFLKSDPECRWLQITAPSAAGSSGGPLLNARGEVIGVVAWIVPSQGMGFAVQAQHLSDLKKRLSQKVFSLPVPGSFLGPGVSDPAVLEELALLRGELQDYFTKVRSVADRERAMEIAKSENPIPGHIGNFRKLAERHPGTRLEFEVLATIVRLAHDDSPESREALRWAYGRLLSTYVSAEPLGGLLMELCQAQGPEVQAFLRQAIVRSPHPQVKGLGCTALGLALQADPRTRGRNEDESIAALERAATEFGAVEIGDATLKDLVAPLLRNAKSLAPGRFAQEIEGKDSSGRAFQLRDYRGKVVLLDFWVDWCPYCRQMYPHERRLLQQYAGQPLVLLGVNCEGLARQQSVEASKAVTWRSWADGPQGPIAQQWNVTGYPTLYLIDSRGRIRSKGYLRGEVLDAAVQTAIEEIRLGLSNDLIEPCSVWNYRDDDAEPEKEWRRPGFDDSAWKSGRAVLGYGYGDEATTLDFGTNEENKHTTVYFRKRFDVKDPASLPGLTISLCRVGGIAVYINDREILRQDLAQNTQHGDRAAGAEDSLLCQHFDLDPKILRAGGNLLAVEVHRRHPKDGGLRFDLTLSGQKWTSNRSVVESLPAAHGLGGLDKIDPTKFAQSWRTDKDFAKISSAGQITFPKVSACRYVLETELTIGNPQKGRVLYRIADGSYGTELSLGSVWPNDRTQNTVACRLFGTTPSGVIYWVGEKQFSIGQRLALKLIAVDEERVLFCNGKRVLGIDGPPLDFTLEICADGTPDCTIQSCAVRPLNESDTQAIGRAVLAYDLQLDAEKTARRIREQTSGLPTAAASGKPFLVKSVDAAMRWIPAGEFTMAERDGKGKHRVRLSQGFWIGQYTVTQEQWSRLLDNNPSRFRGSPYLPVHWVSWEDAVRFCDELDSRERKAGRLPVGYKYRLPTEAEWEYACKAGSDEDQPKNPSEGWWRGNAGRRLHEVGELPPNRWGLYDMCGNAAQWCLDVWQPYPVESSEVQQDPCQLRKSDQDRLCVRGGDWWRSKPEDVQPTSRKMSRSVASAYRGFRIVLGKTLTKAE